MYKYSLDPTSKKYPCPVCGHKSFVVYIDTESKEPVDEHQFGRCDRENSCAHHLHPSSDPLATKGRPESFTPRPDPIIVQIFPDERLWKPIIDRTKTCVSPFHTFCNRLTIPNDHLLRWGIYSDTDSHGALLTVYVYRNADGKICNLKWFKYLDNGHRDKDFNSFSLRQPPTPPNKKNSDGVSNEMQSAERVEKYLLCLFGEHLLDPDKKKIVCVVESEKTAAIASFFYPQFDWVSCGAANGLTMEKTDVLKGRTVYWLSDADKAGRMSVNNDEQGKQKIKPSSVRHLIEAIESFHIADLFQDRHDGYDIGDAIVDGLRPEIKPTWSKSKEGEPMAYQSDEQFQYDLPKGVTWDKVKDDIQQYSHFEHAGRIYIIRKRKGNDDGKGAPYFATDVTNFTIRSLGLISNDTDPVRLLEIKNVYGVTQVVKMPTKGFVSPQEFTAFVESVGNFQYDGIGNDLKKIRAKLYNTMMTFDEVETLGWHYTGYFLFANGAYNGKFTPIDKYGFVKLGEKNFFIQPLSCIHREESEDFEDEKKFVFKEKTDVTFKDYARQFCDVHKDNGRIALAWYIASLFRDFIYNRFKFFPHLFLFGPPGTGKSQVGWSVRSLGFTGLVKPFNLNTGTAVSFHREFAQFKNFPAWCDEYDNSIAYERIQALKAAYDGVGHKKSVKDSDKRTKSTQVNRAIMISGQQLPIADNALFKRVILLQFHQTEYNDQEKKMFGDLQRMEEGGLSFITAGFMHFRKEIETHYYNTFDDVMSELVALAEAGKMDVEDRIVRNACIVLTCFKVIEKKLGDHLPCTYDALKAIMMKNIQDQMDLIKNTNETNTFWDTVAFLVRKNELKEAEDFVFDNQQIVKSVYNAEGMVDLGKPTELLFMRMTKVIPMYREAFKRQNSSTASPMDKGSLEHYLKHSRAFIGMVSQKNFKDSRTSAYCFNYEVLKRAGIFLGGSEKLDGAPPPPGEPSPQGAPPPGVDDLPF